jgi:hypothetical protein
MERQQALNQVLRASELNEMKPMQSFEVCWSISADIDYSDLLGQ